MILNLIHPYLYRADYKNRTVDFGPSSTIRDRDKKVFSLIRAFLDFSEDVYWYRDRFVDEDDQRMLKTKLRSDPLYAFLFHPKIKRVSTGPSGIPLSKRGRVRTSNTPMIFVGAYFERCVMRSIGFFKLKSPDREVFYIPELCVSVDEAIFMTNEERKRCEKEITKYRAQPLTSSDALDLLSR